MVLIPHIFSLICPAAEVGGGGGGGSVVKLGHHSHTSYTRCFLNKKSSKSDNPYIYCTIEIIEIR